MFLFGYYIEDKLDRAWFESSNIVYAECDESDNEFKTVRVVFKNGSQYQYSNVHVTDWITFKRAESQGKCLNERFKKTGIEYKKLDNINVEKLMDEYAFRSGNGLYIKVEENSISIIDNKDVVKYIMTDINAYEIKDKIKEMLEALNYVVKMID